MVKQRSHQWVYRVGKVGVMSWHRMIGQKRVVRIKNGMLPVGFEPTTFRSSV